MANNEKGFDTITSNNENDEDWFVSKAVSCAKYDCYSARALLLTGKTLFPQSFLLQFELYKIEKEKKNVVEVAKLLEEMLLAFPHESIVKQEVISIIDHLQEQGGDECAAFYQNVFAKLPAILQCTLLLQTANGMKDVIQQARLMTFVLSRYPDTVARQGIILVDSLLLMEKKLQIDSPLNVYRKFLVCEVLPLVLKAPTSADVQKHVIVWLQKAIEFLVVSAANKSSPLENDSKGKGNATVSPCEYDLQVSNPWQRLQELISLAAMQLSWPQNDRLPKYSIENDVEWLKSWVLRSADNHQMVLYSAIVLLLRCIFNYTKHVNSILLDGSSSLHTMPLVLFEAPQDCMCNGITEFSVPQKQPRMENPAVPIIFSKSIASSADIILQFTTALQCWEILHLSETLTEEFKKLCILWRTDSWIWLRAFRIDALLYEGSIAQAVAELEVLHAQGEQDITSSPHQIRRTFQLAICYFRQKLYKKCFNLFIGILQQFSLSMESFAAITLCSSCTNGRHLHMVSCQQNELLPIIIHFLILALKEKSLTNVDDLSIGHLLVLTQYDWPRYASVCREILATIRAKKNFSYNTFFTYIINIDILEEFVFLRTPEGGTINLNILPGSSKTASLSRTVTRGVNRGVKEDFRSAFEKQVTTRCGENVDLLLKKFLETEFKSLNDIFT